MAERKVPRKRAVFDSFLAVLSPSVAIFQMINLTLCHECKSWLCLFLFLLTPTLLAFQPKLPRNKTKSTLNKSSLFHKCLLLFYFLVFRKTNTRVVNENLLWFSDFVLLLLFLFISHNFSLFFTTWNRREWRGVGSWGIVQNLWWFLIRIELSLILNWAPAHYKLFCC